MSCKFIIFRIQYEADSLCRVRQGKERISTMASTFIDKAKITVKAGAGGNGCVSFHREKYIDRKSVV